MKNLWIITLIFVLLLCGCKSKQRISEKQEITRIDTVTVVQEKIDTIFRDRIIEKTKPVYFETEIPCDSLASGRVGSGGNYTEYRIENGRIFLKSQIDSTQNYWQEYYQSKFEKDSTAIRKDIVKDSSIEDVTTVYVYPWHYYAFMIGAILLLAWKIANWLKIIPI